MRMILDDLYQGEDGYQRDQSWDNHKPAAYWAGQIDDPQSYFAWTFIRHPWERMVSNWTYDRPDREGRSFHHPQYDAGRMPFSDWVRRGETSSTPIDQFTQGLRVRVYRLEDFQAALIDLGQRLGWEAVPDARRDNQSDHPAYQSMYDDDLAQIVRERFASDIRLGGYQF